MTKLVAIKDGDRWLTIEVPARADRAEPDEPPKQEAQRQLAVIDPVDEVSRLLGRAVRLARQLSPSDARKIRDLFHAAQGMLTAATYLDSEGQERFEKGLRGAFNT